MRAAPNNIIVLIENAERRKQFEKQIVNHLGHTITLLTSVPALSNEESAYEQTVTVAKVISVGCNVIGIQIGDDVLIDYMADADDTIILEEDEAGKYLSLLAITSFHNEDLIVDANRRTPHPTAVYRKGELNEVSMVIAYIRRKIVYANEPYVLLNHVDEQDWELNESKVFAIEERVNDTWERTVLVAHNNCNYKVGEAILIKEESVFPRTINGISFDVAFEHDILVPVEWLKEQIKNYKNLSS